MDKTKINDINTLVDTIVNYYSFKDRDSQGEEWKKGTHLDESSVVPNDVDELVRKLFIKELKKLTD